VVFTLHIHIMLQKGTWITCLLNSRNRTDLGCYVLQVQSCRFCVNLERARYHAVDVGFRVVLKLIIQWIWPLIRSGRFIIFGDVCSFFMDPDSALQPYSVVLSRVKHVYKLCFKYCMLLDFHIWIVSCGG
jgi:hypothetical protein